MLAARPLAVTVAIGVSVTTGSSAPLAGATTVAPVNLPRVLARQIAAVHRLRPGLPVLLPSTLVLEGPSYASGGPLAGGYTLELALAPGCHEATACFLADFSAQRHARLLLGRPSVRLIRGLSGAFRPLSCGASCSPPSISWVQGSVRYTMQFPVEGSDAHARAVLIAAADAAIRGGPR